MTGKGSVDFQVGVYRIIRMALRERLEDGFGGEYDHGAGSIETAT